MLQVRGGVLVVGPKREASMKHEGIPTGPGFYWIVRKGRAEVVEVKQTNGGELWADGYGDTPLEELSDVWQRVKPYDDAMDINQQCGSCRWFSPPVIGSGLCTLYNQLTNHTDSCDKYEHQERRFRA